LPFLIKEKMENDRQQEAYQDRLADKEREWENQCLRCGACCGAYKDPCRDLKKGSDGKYSCGVYSRRYGAHETVGGKKFRCMPIRDIIHMSWDHDQFCAYKKAIKP
jgi:hypothetical protein